jgi:hypothetical protein
MAWPYQTITLTPTDRSAQFGSSVLGETVTNEANQLTGELTYGIVNGYYTCTIGHGQFRKRGYSRPIPYYVRPRNDRQGSKFASVSILSTTGALIGRIRSDVQKTIISNLEFTIVKGDCRDFVLELNALPDFPLAPFSVIQINIGDSDFNWFIGKITDQEGLGAKNGKKFVFKGEGLTKTDLEALVFDDTLNFESALDVGEIVNSIAQDQISPNTFINYNPSKIDTNTGVFTANVIEPGKSKMPKFLDALAKMANCDWGVDGDGDFFFLPSVTNTVRTFFVGYDLNDFVPRLNLQNVRNTIFLQRQRGKGSGGAGWVVSGIKTDDTSIAKYGKREYRFQAPGFFSDNDLDVIGNSLLNDLKEPRFSSQSTGFQVFGESQFIGRGVHRFILPFDTFPETWTETENANEWTADSGITLSDSTDYFVFGASSVKAVVNNASGGHIERISEFKGNIQKVIIWLRSNLAGAYLTAGIGLSSWNQYTNKINIPVANAFFAYEWDLSNLELMKIDKVGFGIDTNDAFELYIDKIEFVIKGFPYYKMQSSKQTYSFAPESSEVRMEFDKVPSKMEDYINNILAIAEENRFVGEVR